MTLGIGGVRVITGAGTTIRGITGTGIMTRGITTIIIPATTLAGTHTAGTVAETVNTSTGL